VQPKSQAALKLESVFSGANPAAPLCPIIVKSNFDKWLVNRVSLLFKLQAADKRLLE